MSLTDKIKKIARNEGLEAKELKLDRIKRIMQEHDSHGKTYKIELWYDGNTLNSIFLECTGDKLVNTEECTHNNPEYDEDVEGELTIYSRKGIYR